MDISIDDIKKMAECLDAQDVPSKGRKILWMGGNGEIYETMMEELNNRTKTMPLTKKGKKIKAAMMAEYGKEKGEQVFYATENKGKIKGVTKRKKK